MASSGIVPILAAAFSFGILTTAALAALAYHIIDNGSYCFKNGQRLALTGFFAFSLMWAATSFAGITIDMGAVAGCTVVVVISSLLDQLARVFIEQSLLWTMATPSGGFGLHSTTQLLMLGRFALGIGFSAVSRAQFNPACIPRSSVSLVAILLIALDGVLWLMLVILSSKTNAEKKMPVICGTVGLAIWMVASIGLLLGSENIHILLRTTAPAVGLSVLIVLTTPLIGISTVPKPSQIRRLDSPVFRDLNGVQQVRTVGSVDFPPSQYEEIRGLKGPAAAGAPDRETFNANMPQEDAQKLPTIARPVTGVTGMGGLPIQGQLFPPARSEASPVVTSQLSTPSETELSESMPGIFSRSKRSIFSRGNGQSGKSVDVRNLAISNPVLIDTPGTKTALSRVQTVDLATAARNESLRRTGQVRVLDAMHSAPPPPVSMKETIIRGETFSRKGVPRATPARLELGGQLPRDKTTNNDALSPFRNASSTASQPSPSGGEALRRRSPRKPVATTRSRPMPNPSSRTSPDPTQAKTPEPVKTPLQRRPTTGLPNNPRAVRANPKQPNQNDHAVMFINNFEFHDPTAVDGARNIVQVFEDLSPLQKSSASVIHRPRPIPRQSDSERTVFPAEASPSLSHRRSRSGASSTMWSAPGSPTNLPELPPVPAPPKSAGRLLSPNSKNGKTMTVEEKMVKFYADDSSSVVPELPSFPPIIMTNKSEFEDRSLHRISKKSDTDRSSLRTQDLFDTDDYLSNSRRGTVTESAGNQEQRQSSKASVRTGVNRSSSPVLPLALSATTSGSQHDFQRSPDHRPNKELVDAPAGTEAGSKGAITLLPTVFGGKSQKPPRPRVSVPSTSSLYGDSVMTVMLDTSPDQSRASPDQSTQRHDVKSRSPSSSSEPGFPSGFFAPGHYHHRVGDDCPTFSARIDKSKTRSRMTPPAPLQLAARYARKPIIIQQPKLSPLETPGKALNSIQAQLDRLELSSRVSVQAVDKRDLLLNLELEMGQQENKWQKMQNQIDRGSLATIRNSLLLESPNSASPSQSTLIAEAPAVKKSQPRDVENENQRLKAGSTTKTLNPGNERTSLFEARLTGAQAKFKDHTSEPSSDRDNLNFLDISRSNSTSSQPSSKNSPVGNSGLWKSSSSPHQSPTPEALWSAPPSPTSDTRSRIKAPSPTSRPVLRIAVSPLPIESSELWQRSMKADEMTESESLWASGDMMREPELQVEAQTESPEPQAESQEESEVIPQAHKPLRPVTQRPPRRSRRITALPDIVESPLPLPHKRDTMGFFRFPWGEKSDNVALPMHRSQVSSTLHEENDSMSRASSFQGNGAHSDQMKSFFDLGDVSEDEESEDDSEADTDSGDDDFDENTIWEIASLLQSDRAAVPSKESLLPGGAIQASFLEQYGSTLLAGDRTSVQDNSFSKAGDMMDRENTAHPNKELEDSTSRERPTTWLVNSSIATAPGSYGLPQSDGDTWKKYIPHSGAPVPLRARSREPELSTNESEDLWSPLSPDSANTMSIALLWPSPSRAQPTQPQVDPQSGLGNDFEETGSSQMWNQGPVHADESADGLFDVNLGRTDYRRTIEPPAALLTKRTSRSAESSPERLASRDLWMRKPADQSETTHSLLWTSPTVLSPEPASGHDSDEFELAMNENDHNINEEVESEPKQPLSEQNSDLIVSASTSASGFEQSRLGVPDVSPLEASEPDHLRKADGSPTMYRPDHGPMIFIDESSSSSLSAEEKQVPSIDDMYVAGLFEPGQQPGVIRDETADIPLPQAEAAAPYLDIPNLSIIKADQTMPEQDLEVISRGAADISLSLNEAATPLNVARLSIIDIAEFESMNRSQADAVSIEDDFAEFSLPQAETSAPYLEIPNLPILRTNEPGNQSSFFDLMTQEQEIVAAAEQDGEVISVGSIEFSLPEAKPAPPYLEVPDSPVLAASMSNDYVDYSNSLVQDENSDVLADGDLQVPNLFVLDSNRTTYRTTAAEPAALTIARKQPRVDTAALPDIESVQLWKGNLESTELDWITISSVRPRSPSAASEASSGRSSLASFPNDAASFVTTATNATSILPSPRSIRALDKDSKEHEIPPVPDMKLFNSFPSTSELKALNRKTASAREWSEALYQALAASFPGKKDWIHEVHPEQWGVELHEGIAASTIAEQAE